MARRNRSIPEGRWGVGWMPTIGMPKVSRKKFRLRLSTPRPKESFHGPKEIVPWPEGRWGSG